MKILKNKKALSPVVASIILIAVTVAVSIAVAAWMGALTVGFMGSSSLTITDVTFATPDQVTLAIKNTGTKDVTVSQVKVNNVIVTSYTMNSFKLASGAGPANLALTLNAAWVAGNPYKFDLFDNNGQVIGSYQATA